jgi:anti-sigma-K factor RskA
MMDHRHIEELLYDYVTGTLTPEDKQQVEEHCATCSECRSDLRGIRTVIGSLDPALHRASDRQGDQFWLEFADRVERAVRDRSNATPSFWESFFDQLKEILTSSWKPVGAAAGALGLALIAFLISISLQQHPAENPATTVETIQPDTTVQQLAQYLRKSKSLLVGLNNLKPDRGGHMDLAAERRTSRQLVMEARALRNHPLDPQSTQLVGDLEKLFIEFGSAEENREEPVLRLVRSGMDQENVLFKIRMAETAYGAGRFVQAGGRSAGGTR